MKTLGRFAAAASLATAILAIAAMQPAAAREVVAVDAPYRAGTIVVRTAERKLYLMLGSGQAIRYKIAVGKPGKEWTGEARIARKEVDPIWGPPEEVKRDRPDLPDLIPPGPQNPLGPRAMVLDYGQYAIHGTNRRDSIGTRASYGCIRMYNEDVVELFDRVAVGTTVIVER